LPIVPVSPREPFSGYSRNVLAEPRRRSVAPPEIAAVEDVVAEDLASGFCGAVVDCTAATVTLEDRLGRTRTFPLSPGAFAIDGQAVTLVRPVAPRAARTLSASGSVRVENLRARTARAARIWVEGIHDATLVERVWGHDLRVEGIVVEPLHGLDHLADRLDEFQPEAHRRVGVLTDHLVPGSKEERIAEAVSRRRDGAAVLVTGHPYVDIWQAVRPTVVGIAEWPSVPRGCDWKQGICEQLQVTGGPDAMWRRVNGAVSTVRDLQTPLVTAVERLLDFVTGTPS
jgi:hypothetical protein